MYVTRRLGGGTFQEQNHEIKIKYWFLFHAQCDAGGEGVMEVTVLRGRNLVPKDSNGKLFLSECLVIVLSV